MALTFKGLCIGGSRAGEWLSCAHSSFVEPPIHLERNGPHGPLRVNYARITYVHCVAEDVCEFWVLEGNNAAWAVQELVRTCRDANAHYDASGQRLEDGNLFKLVAHL
jgi:hypothetical protein